MKAIGALFSLLATAACARHLSSPRALPWTSPPGLPSAVAARLGERSAWTGAIKTALLTRGGAEPSVGGSSSTAGSDGELVLAVQRLGGWSEAEASGALTEASGDVGLAHAALAEAEEAAVVAAQAAGLAELTAKGYDADGANTSVYILVTCVCIGARRRVSMPVAKDNTCPALCWLPFLCCGMGRQWRRARCARA